MTRYNFSIFGSVVWLIVLTIGVGLVLGTPIHILSFFLESLSTSDQFYPPILEFSIAFLNLILILKILPHTVNHKVASDSMLSFIGVKRVALKTSMLILVISIFYFSIESLILSEFFKQPVPESMIQLRNRFDGVLNGLLLVISVCILGPIIEELIFRGILFQRLFYSKVGPTGAVVLTSLAFAVAHFHYSPIQMLSIFAFGIFLGLLRLTTSNIVYPIAIHSLANAIALGFLLN